MMREEKQKEEPEEEGAAEVMKERRGMKERESEQVARVSEASVRPPFV